MKITRSTLNIPKVAFLIFLLSFPSITFAEQLYAPQFLWDKGIATKTDPIDVANTYLGIPYRDDGALDDKGRFTTFDNPSQFYDTPGLNCSGLVVSVCRFLFNKNWTLEEVTRDRLGDSGENSPNGKDWDFGFDLILNITQDYSPKIIMPDGQDYPLANANGMNMRGFDLHDADSWAKVMKSMKPGNIYLGSISKSGAARGYKIMHYHVVLMLPDGKGGVWLYHATRRSQVHRMDIASAQGFQRFMSQFKSGRGDTKKILVVEAKLPEIVVGENTPNQKSDQQAQIPGVSGTSQDQIQRPSQETIIEQPEPTATPQSPQPQAQPEIGVVLNHLSGKVFKSFPELTTSVPKLITAPNPSVKFTFTNRGNIPKAITFFMQGPDGKVQYQGTLPENKIVHLVYPRDFGISGKDLSKGQYLADVRIDGKQWFADVFEVAVPHEAEPKITNVKIPSVVPAGKSFEVKVEAINQGAESDYGGITVSSPDPSGLKIIGAKPGKVFGAGSTVLAVTTDRIRTKVPMAERWIELWGENKSYDMTVQIQAGKPGVYHLYVRCALRGVNVKSNVIIMDPKSSNTVDQQGFPVQVYEITVK